MNKRRPDIPNGSVVKAKESDEVFLIDNGKRMFIPDPVVAVAKGVDANKVMEVSEDDLSQFTWGPPVLTGPSGRIKIYGRDYVGGAKSHHMETDGGLDITTGVVACKTQTWTDTWFGGFHGAVYLIMSDEEGVPTAQTQSHRYGVDGTVVGTSNRTDFWSESIDKDAAARSQGVTVFHYWAADDIKTRLQKAIDLLKPIGEIIQTAKQMGAAATYNPK